MAQPTNERILLPRVIYGNRGDILSRWGLLNGLLAIGEKEVHVFAHRSSDLPEPMKSHFDQYGKYHNLVLSPSARYALRNADRVLWGGGLDMTDESSMAKLLYLLAIFSQYRMIGKRIDCTFQGAGPLGTRTGKIISRQILKRVSTFIARDERSYELVNQLNPSLPCLLAGDAIFMPGFEEQIKENSDPAVMKEYLPSHGKPVVAVNMRRWFHFSSDLIPFQMAQRRYENRGQEQMQQLVEIYVNLVRKIRKQYDARILLVSAYNPGVFSWEDDLPWLAKIKSSFAGDEDVLLMDKDLNMVDYMSLMSKVDLAISMRLHSSLTVMRFGNPAINISYSSKGMGGFHTLGLDDHAVHITGIMQEPGLLWQKVETSFQDLKGEKQRVTQNVGAVIAKNLAALRSLFNK
ncbi:MAG: hypothetical protein GYA45_04440 [Pelolinea sp.]|jgi:polysaccharide pyruvyl transferase WcaK-like protein|nr:hypothetical protein [Pelolinea sp.]